MASTGRAGCQNPNCKKAGIKIEKGEFRMGTHVLIREHYTWMWKHWYVLPTAPCKRFLCGCRLSQARGCVTPTQIANLQAQVGPLEDLDLDRDLADIIDGYDEISAESQEKIKFALQHGHVPDEDWKGVSSNRFPSSGVPLRTNEAPVGS